MKLDDNEKLVEQQIGKLIELQTRMRWTFVLFLWLTLGSFCLWWLRYDIALWLEFFTWSAVRISLQHNRLVFLGLGLCVAMTLSTLIGMMIVDVQIAGCLDIQINQAMGTNLVQHMV